MLFIAPPIGVLQLMLTDLLLSEFITPYAKLTKNMLILHELNRNFSEQMPIFP